MEKKLEAQLDTESMTTVNVKEYAPSEAFSAEPPPAYHRPKSTAVQVARIAAITVVLVSFILGGFIFAAAWVQANSACQDALNEQLARMDQLLEDRAAMGPQFQALVSGEPLQAESGEQPVKREEARVVSSKREDQDRDDQEDTREQDQQENSVDPPIHLKLPLQLDFDELAGALMERNQRSRMNCVVEKRRAEEVVDHQPRTVRLPFGLNLTTDPRYEHLSGERMAIFCESGHDQRHVPMEQMMPMQQQQPMPMQQQQPMPMQPMPQQLQEQFIRPQQIQQQIQQHLQQLHMQHLQQQQMQQQQQQQPPQQPPHFGPQQVPIQVLPMSHPEARGFQQHGVPLELRGVPVQAAMTVEVEGPRGGEPMEVEGRSLSPQQLQQLEQLQQLQQLPDGPQILPVEVIEARAFQHAPEMHQPQGPPAPMPADTLRPPFQRTPIHAVPPQEEEPRPHYVQPRSIRSVDSVFPSPALHREKRVRRCACDCNC